jgi:hypothetical protein
MRKGLTAFSIVVAASVASSLSISAQTAQTPNTPTVNSAFKSAVPASDVYFLNRAKNLARQAAINANGGLGKYRPDPVMYGPAIQTVYARNNDGSITFRFNGSAPGIATPKFETVATVAANGVVSLDYNGTPRTAIGAASLPSPPSVGSPISTAAPEPPKSSVPSTIPLTPSDGPLPQQPSAISPTSTSVTAVPAGTPSTIAWVDQDAFVARAQNLARQAAIKANGGLTAYRPEPSMFGPSAKSPFVKNADGSITFSFQGGTPGASLTLISVVVVHPDGSVKIQYNGPPVR